MPRRGRRAALGRRTRTCIGGRAQAAPYVEAFFFTTRSTPCFFLIYRVAQGPYGITRSPPKGLSLSRWCCVSSEQTLILRNADPVRTPSVSIDVAARLWVIPWDTEVSRWRRGGRRTYTRAASGAPPELAQRCDSWLATPLLFVAPTHPHLSSVSLLLYVGGGLSLSRRCCVSSEQTWKRMHLCE